ncbi:hypothetical protein Hanom_Chr03g00252371 [Helianthus anomalus]
MDPSNAQVASGAVGDPTTESGDWRAQLAADSRERIRHKMYELVLFLKFLVSFLCDKKLIVETTYSSVDCLNGYVEEASSVLWRRGTRGA